MTKPNILLIHSDQHRWDCLGCHGHPLLSSPHLDRLAAEGVDFTQACTPCPICSPERASLLTGVWPARHGCYSIPGSELFRSAAPERPRWSQGLQAQGYRLGWVGKHHGEIQGGPLADGWDAHVGEGRYPAWRAERGLAPLPTRRNADPDWMLQWFGAVDQAADEQSTRLAWGCDQTLELMRSSHGEGRPWMLRWDPSEPHLPCRPPPAVAARYPAARVPPWPGCADTHQGKPWIQQQQPQTWGVADWTWEDWAPVAARYLAEIDHLDAQVGRLLEELDRLGQAENTLVLYCTDHGDLCGSRGSMDKHFQMFDDVLRVPLLARWPARLPAGQRCAEPASSAIDIAATIAAAAGLGSFGEGRDLVALATGGAAERWSESFASYHGCQMGNWSTRCVRSPEWKYIWNATDPDELYHLASDPHELVNRLDDPACAGVLRDQRQRLLGWMERSGDQLLNPWTQRAILG